MKSRLQQAALRQPRFAVVEQQAAADFLSQQSVRRIFAVVAIVGEQNLLDVIGMANQVNDVAAHLIAHDVAISGMVAQQRIDGFFPVMRRTLNRLKRIGAGRALCVARRLMRRNDNFFLPQKT